MSGIRAASGVLGLAAAMIFHVASTAQAQDFPQIERGRYLATVGDCVACHTVPGGTPFAGGRPLETPFGTLVSPNLTPDRATGIGAWTDDEFVSAVTQGIGPGGQHIYPALPYAYYTKVPRTDVLAIRAYLSTLPPTRNDVVSNQLPFPFNIRASLIAWNALNFTPGEYKPDPAHDAEWNQGALLVQGLGHCGACHTAKNLTGGDSGATYQGGVLQGWYAPNITNDQRAGLGTWSTEDIATYLRTGHTRTAAASGPMAEVVSYSTSNMTEADLHAMATYLKSLPGQDRNPTPVPADDPAMKDGLALYDAQCSACHSQNGAGVPGLLPALAGAPTVQGTNATSLMRVILAGAQSVATTPAPTGAAMPAFGWKLTDPQIAAVTTYIRNAWGNAASPVSAGDVRRLRGTLAQNRE